jgi:5-formyltetrahydrofolate cyclo-ligase
MMTKGAEAQHEGKQLLRREMLTKRSGLSGEEWLLKCDSITSRLQRMEEIVSASRLHLYISMDQQREVSTSGMIDWLCSEKKQVSVPYIQNGEMVSVFYERCERLVRGIHGQPEPESVRPDQEEKFDVVLVPLVAVDNRGYRLGYGAGYYDRFFSRLAGKGIHPLRIGLAFALQVVPAVPRESWDERLDFVVTENGIIECLQS